MNAPASDRCIFMSYSTTPPENVDFVRYVRRQLGRAGFDVWLDEERLPPGTDIQDRITSAVDECKLAILIITKEWLAKDWTRYEGEMLAQSCDTILKVHREQIKSRDLGPRLHRFKYVDWRPGDPDPDAKLWEVICGLVDQPPGDRRLWGQRARELVGQSPESPPMSPPAGKRRDPVPGHPGRDIPHAGSTVPVMSWANENQVFVLMEDGQWIATSPDDLEIQRIPEINAPVSDAAWDGDHLVAALYRPRLAKLSGGTWDYLSVEDPVLRLCPTEIGLAAGDAAGRLSVLQGNTLVPVARAEEPLIDLHDCDGALVALDATGRLWRTAWPSDGTLESVETGALGRAVELFSTGTGGRVGVFSQTCVGTLVAAAGWSLTVSSPLQDGIEKVVAFSQRGVFGVLSDAGELWIVNLQTNAWQPVSLPETRARIAHLAKGPQGRVLAWTESGDLFLVQSTGIVRQLGASAVIWAQTPSNSRGILAFAIERNRFTVQRIDG